jgi:AcrR family transcriptional regulator
VVNVPSPDRAAAPDAASDGAPDDAASALERSQAARRRRVLDATFRLADAGGFDAVQMRDVAAAADVAVGTVYRYFISKERLLLEAMAEQQERLLAHLRRNPPAEATAAERVTSVLRRANGSLRRHPHVTAAMVRAHGACRPELADLIERVGRLMTEIITFAIHPEGGPVEERDVRVARVLQLAWLSSLIGWVGGAQGPDGVDADLDSAARLLLESAR